MKTKTLYQCEYCNTQYAVEKEAMRCEEHHKNPLEITKPKYRSHKNGSDGYPDTIVVVFDNNKEIRYKRG